MKSKIETDLLIGELVYKQLKGELSADEEELVNSWVSNAENKDFFLSLKNTDRLYQGMLKEQYIDLDAQFGKLQRSLAKKKHYRIWPWFTGVAALLAIGVVVFLFFRRPQSEMILPEMAKLLPVEDCNRLHTAGGELVYLADSVKEISVTAVESRKEESVVPELVPVQLGVKYNVLATSSHGQIEMRLSDSSRVWLNAGSELRYPDVFGKDCRQVYLRGEAYFEVSKNPERPFIVNVGDTKVEVLGTQFNVKSLGANGCRTTLVEGRVRVQAAGKSTVELLPDQQAEVRENGGIDVREVDVRYAIAWKKNQFAFHEQSLYRILTELSEWYDFTFSFGNIVQANLIYTAIIPRSPSVDDVLQLLERTGDFSYTIENNRHITIRPR